ncbi:hypothetical protein QYF36_023125 [Acer negundo]|nr:hypothetical protein QYF36_023125 [Acer negundo]
MANLNIKAAKFTAVLKSVQFSMDCGLAPCVFEMDDALVVKWINDGQVNLSETGVLLDDINSLASNLRNVNFLHTSKRANGVARSLAIWMEEYSTCISNLVMADKPG